MKAFLQCFLKMVIGLVTSKKVITGAITAVATTLIEDKETALRVAGIGTAVVLGIAAQDVGKEKARIQADADLPEITP